MNRDEVWTTALAWSREKKRVAIATVVDTWGSSPRPRGSQLAVRDDGLFVGSVSGGCVEGKVVEAALTAMNDRTTRLLEFGVSNEDAWGVGLACGGTVRIFVAPVGPEYLGSEIISRACESIEKNSPFVVVLPLERGGARIVDSKNSRDEILSDEVRAACARVLASDAAERIATKDGEVFLLPKNAPRRLIIVGAVHIAKPLAEIATLLEYDVTIVDPRSAFARAERFPDARIACEWPDEALARMAIDARTAIVTLTHDPKIDDVALEVAVASDAFYIGALGSKKTHAARVARLSEKGIDRESIEKIRGPVGLAIGAKSPAEIAISIASEMTAALRADA